MLDSSFLGKLVAYGLILVLWSTNTASSLEKAGNGRLFLTLASSSLASHASGSLTFPISTAKSYGDISNWMQPSLFKSSTISAPPWGGDLHPKAAAFPQGIGEGSGSPTAPVGSPPSLSPKPWQGREAAARSLLALAHCLRRGRGRKGDFDC